jgi:hypothetical protein
MRWTVLPSDLTRVLLPLCVLASAILAGSAGNRFC